MRPPTPLPAGKSSKKDTDSPAVNQTIRLFKSAPRIYRRGGVSRKGAASLTRVSIRKTSDKPGLEEVRSAVEQALGQKNRFTRNAAIYLTHAKTGYSLKEIAAFYALSPSTVGSIARRMRKNLAWNIVVKHVLDHVQKEIFPIRRSGAGDFPSRLI